MTMNRIVTVMAAFMMVACLGIVACDAVDAEGEEVPAGTTEYVVAYVVDGLTITSEKVSAGDSHTLMACESKHVPEGKQFTGWKDGEVKYPVGTVLTIDSDKTFVADIVDATYTVTFVADGKTVAEVKDQPYNATVTAPAEDPVKEGFYFGGWADATGKIVEEFPVVKSDVIYTAVFLVDYRISFVVEGVTVSSGSVTDYTVPGAPSKEHYSFMGWAVDGQVVIAPATTEGQVLRIPATYIVSQDTAFTAQFVADTLTVTMKVGETVFNTQTVLYGQKAVEPMKLDGYSGWTLDPLAEVVEVFDFNTIVTENLVLYAIEEEVVVTEEIVITYVYVDGQTAQHTIVKGSTDVFPTDVAKEGFDFIGWFIGMEQVKDPSKQVFEEDTIVIAQYVLSDPPVEPEPKFYKTTAGQCAIILGIFVLGLALYQGNRMGYFAPIKDKLFKKKVPEVIEEEEADKP